MPVNTNPTQPTSSLADNKSRYVKGGETELDGNYLGWWELNPITPSVDDITITIPKKYHQRPDLLAFDVYGKAKYQWLILQFNTILDIEVEFVEGRKITIPSPARAAFSYS